ncbi:MAG: polysaccharide deacetylase family protein [Erysipelotrichaceae bacterium]|nr:polysaccharide deacetylase family protein [Erysipelotrichaceae bacterium]
MKTRKTIKVILTSLITIFMLITSIMGQVDGASSQVITSGSTSEKVVALTFDDFAGDEAQVILGVLNSYGVNASFFFLGSSIKSNPDLVSQIYEAGNYVGNHSYSHPYLSQLSEEDILTELQDTDAIIQDVTGHSAMPYFRPPYGDYDSAVLQVAGDAGFTKAIMWTIDTEDYDGISAEQIVSNAVNNVSPGAIILMHTGGSATNTQFALPTIIENLQAEGYSFMTIPELLGDTTTPTYPTVSYSAHVQSIGWQSYVAEGSVAGTIGQALRIEALKVDIAPASFSGTIEYRSHVQTYGWQDWVSDNQVSGTTGLAKRLEAIEIRLTGELASNFDVVYRTYVQNFGWLDWAKNGESAGSSGYGYRMEAIEIRIVPQGDYWTGPTSFVAKSSSSSSTVGVTYRAHVQSIGWQLAVSDGETAGTVGLAKRMEALTVSLTTGASGGVTYQAHVQSIGWQAAVSDGQVAGTTGLAKRMEAIRIALTGTVATQYDVIYRVHVQHFGWLGWAKNGESAGSTGYGYRMEAIEIRLVPRGSVSTNPAASFKSV